MKRFIKFSSIFLLLFLFTKIVNADELECKYTISGKYKITLKYYSGTVSSTMDAVEDKWLRNSDFKESDFMKDGTLSCPKTLYYLTYNDDVVVKEPIDISSQKIGLGGSTPLVKEILNPGGPSGDHNQVPDKCTPTGETFAVCEVYETYDASRNLCRQQPLLVEYTNRIKNVDGYNDYFMDYGTKEPSNGKCESDYYYASNDNGEPKCFVKVCIGKAQRRGEICVRCEELKDNDDSNVPIDDTPLGPASPPTCADFQEITGPIWFWIKIIAPILAIVFGTMDLLKAVAASDDKGTRKAVSDFGKRLALCALLFLLHIIVNILVGFTSYGGVGSCL